MPQLLQLEEKDTMPNRRFVLIEGHYVVDTLNPVNSGKCYAIEGAPEDDRDLRERVLSVRLADVLEKLIINSRPRQKDLLGREYQPCNKEAQNIAWSVFLAIK